jgi:hypothetical protein
MKKLRKYWPRLLFFLLWCVIVFIFEPRQKEFYLDPDIDSFANKSNGVFALLEAIVLLFSLIYTIGTVRPFKRILSINLVVIVYLSSIFLFFHRTVAAFGLYLNRQVVKTERKKDFCVGNIAGDTSRNDLVLYDVGAKHVVDEGKLVKPMLRLGFNPKDTIQIVFKRGWFGAEYFDTLGMAKK